MGTKVKVYPKYKGFSHQISLRVEEMSALKTYHKGCGVSRVLVIHPKVSSQSQDVPVRVVKSGRREDRWAEQT